MHIDVHSHLVYPEFIKHLQGRSSHPFAVVEGGTYFIDCSASFRQTLPPRAMGVEEKLQDMEVMGVDVSVLSHGIPGPELLGGEDADYWASRINDHLAEVVDRSGGRFIAWGSVGFGSSERSVAEVDRCINQLGFKGVQLFSNINQRDLDSPELIQVYRHAARLGVPLNMHPTNPINLAGMALSPLVPGMAYIYDTSLAAIRLIQSGLFDQEPGLKLIVPHIGGILPYLGSRVARTIDASAASEDQAKLAHPVQHYLDMLYVDTVGHSVEALEFCYQQVGAARMLYGTDHPFGNYMETAALVDQIHCTVAERELIYHGNSEKLLRIV